MWDVIRQEWFWESEEERLFFKWCCAVGGVEDYITVYNMYHD